MDRLGKDLDKIRKSAVNKKFSLKTVLMIGILHFIFCSTSNKVNIF